MKRDWLWDRKISVNAVKKILSDPSHRDFILFAALLLARKNEPKEVFKEYIDSRIFCKHWTSIKKAMRKDKWNNQRIIFWQAVYEKLIEKYRKKGIKFRGKTLAVVNSLSGRIGFQIRSIRKEQGLSQETLAKKLRISQQLISRIEKGKENICLLTLSNIMRALGRKVNINFT